jgi:hypothetical protein
MLDTRSVAALTLVILAACSRADSSRVATEARQVWILGGIAPEDVTPLALDSDSGTRAESVFWLEGEGHRAVAVGATEPFCGLTLVFERAGTAPLTLTPSTPQAVIRVFHDGTDFLRRDGDVTWPEPAGWRRGTHWAPDGDQDLYWADLSLMRPFPPRDMPWEREVDLVEIDVIPCR